MVTFVFSVLFSVPLAVISLGDKVLSLVSVHEPFPLQSVHFSVTFPVPLQPLHLSDDNRVVYAEEPNLQDG